MQFPIAPLIVVHIIRCMDAANPTGQKMIVTLERLIAFIDSHSPDDKPLVIAHTGEYLNGATLTVRSVWTRGEEHGETIETLPATYASARKWLGY